VLTPDGPDATVVTEVYDCSAAPEHERLQMDSGAVWAEDMAASLERLDAICTRQGKPGLVPAAYQCPRCTTSSNGRRSGFLIGVSGRSAG
jgi:hypothetical protein